MNDEAPEIPKADYNYHETLFQGQWRSGLKPLDIVMPEGPSFEVGVRPGGRAAFLGVREHTPNADAQAQHRMPFTAVI